MKNISLVFKEEKFTCEQHKRDVIFICICKIKLCSECLSCHVHVSLKLFQLKNLKNIYLNKIEEIHKKILKFEEFQSINNFKNEKIKTKPNQSILENVCSYFSAQIKDFHNTLFLEEIKIYILLNELITHSSKHIIDTSKIVSFLQIYNELEVDRSLVALLTKQIKLKNILQLHFMKVRDNLFFDFLKKEYFSSLFRGEEDRNTSKSIQKSELDIEQIFIENSMEKKDQKYSKISQENESCMYKNKLSISLKSFSKSPKKGKIRSDICSKFSLSLSSNSYIYFSNITRKTENNYKSVKQLKSLEILSCQRDSKKNNFYTCENFKEPRMITIKHFQNNKISFSESSDCNSFSPKIQSLKLKEVFNNNLEYINKLEQIEENECDRLKDLCYNKKPLTYYPQPSITKFNTMIYRKEREESNSKYIYNHFKQKLSNTYFFKSQAQFYPQRHVDYDNYNTPTNYSNKYSYHRANSPRIINVKCSICYFPFRVTKQEATFKRNLCFICFKKFNNEKKYHRYNFNDYKAGKINKICPCCGVIFVVPLALSHNRKTCYTCFKSGKIQI
jgi:hypothetical protein